MDNSNKVSRKDQILQALARMLETAPGERITTAALAKEVGVSEAALYRHARFVNSRMRVPLGRPTLEPVKVESAGADAERRRAAEERGRADRPA